MRAPLFLFLLFYSTISLSQGIIVDTTTLGIPQLVRDELMQNACSNESNFKFSSRQGIGKFTNTNPNFPISSGIIIRNGIAKYTEGPYSGSNESTQLNTANDPDLQNISDASGQIVPITDVSYLQFDFTPLSSNFSFDFLFASNEYGEFQCGFSDVFAIILTDLTTGVAKNLAVLPGTDTPVSVINIRNQQYNSSCLSSNPNLFERYNVGNPDPSAINMRGETKVLTTSSTVIPNRTYSIKFAIGDYNDSNYDSAVFIKGGSFKTNMDLGPDRTICEDEKITLESGLTGNYTYVWTLDGNTIPGETNSSLTLDKAGTYGFTATLSGCVLEDEVVIKNLVVKTPENISACYTTNGIYQYDLTQNNLTALGLNPADYTIYYYESLATANANGPNIPEIQLNSFTSVGNQKIYIKIVPVGKAIFCNNLLSFDLLVTPTINITKPPDLRFCETTFGSTVVDLTAQQSPILNGLNPSNYRITYYLSQIDADNDRSNILNPRAFITSISQSPQAIWVRVENIANSFCYATVSFNIIVSPLPPVDKISDIIACNSYTLPSIANGTYYTAPNGDGTQLNSGYVITTSGTYYIYSGSNGASNCSNENNFHVTLIYELLFPKDACGAYIVPSVEAGDFFTQSGGRGDAIPPGTQFTSSQTIYFYAVIDGVVCRDEPLSFIVNPLPPVDKPSDVVTCDSYTLPPLVNGKYYTLSGGLGTSLNSGDKITTSQRLFVYANDGTCPNEHSFKIEIINSLKFIPIAACGSFTLPPITVGGYFDSAGGQGNTIPAGTIITTSQTIYYYATTTTTTNCTDNLKYDITIKPLPLVDTPNDRRECGSYILPVLTNGNYYTESNGGGLPLKAGDVITSTEKIYIYTVGPECTNEHSFTVEITPIPIVDSFTDVVTCTDFRLPRLRNGKYYTATGGPYGLGTQINEGTLITTTQTIFIYYEWSDFAKCSNETFFTVNFNGIDLGVFNDINVCDSYTLPSLKLGNYYAQPAGKGAVIPAGTILTTSQRIYVYHIVGNRLTCANETNFMVNISAKPILASTPDVSICQNYTLPALLLGDYYSEPNANGTKYTAGQSITTSQKIYIYATSAINSSCVAQDDFDITIYTLKDLKLNNGVICVDSQTGTLLNPAALNSGLNASDYVVDWFFEGNKISTGSTYTAQKEGTYTLVSTKTSTNIGDDCGYNPTTIIVEKSGPAIATVTVTDAFEDKIDIIVNFTSGLGIYEYQLDDGDFQTNNIFSDVTSGEHVITIKDIKGNCDDQILIANVLKYPKFFTPNNDTFNDTWNIKDLAFQPSAVINIFDRFGKLIKQLNPSGPGWDGNYNGNPLPSTDYWFQAFYTLNGVSLEFKSHFSLKR